MSRGQRSLSRKMWTIVGAILGIYDVARLMTAAQLQPRYTLLFTPRRPPHLKPFVAPYLPYISSRFGKQRSAALESVTEAAAAGELYPFSAEEEGDGVELEMYSDEEAAGGGLWSGAGTGTEGEVHT